mmetsp:Transcript_17834/g.29813  ORF Transcript_17834/g.29813 Transcript_17834/m.29813 type:complete len:218 (-) Transcript_17834:446-1099(-)
MLDTFSVMLRSLRFISPLSEELSDSSARSVFSRASSDLKSDCRASCVSRSFPCCTCRVSRRPRRSAFSSRSCLLAACSSCSVVCSCFKLSAARASSSARSACRSASCLSTASFSSTRSFNVIFHFASSSSCSWRCCSFSSMVSLSRFTSLACSFWYISILELIDSNCPLSLFFSMVSSASTSSKFFCSVRRSFLASCSSTLRRSAVSLLRNSSWFTR